MLERIKDDWREFRKARPGKRFQQRYRQQRRDGVGRIGRIAWLVLGGVLIVAGLFFTVAPGPGVLLVAFGVALLAQESFAVARKLDGIELRVREALDRRRR